VIHLDTSFLIAATTPGSERAREFKDWMSAGRQMGISAVAWAEFGCGHARSPSSDLLSFLGVPIPFTVDDAVVASQLYNLGGRRRGSLPDCMIAATAIRFGAVLATTDGDFRRYERAGLMLDES
jgi:predicted nucleic acid-binding protein